MRADRSRRAQTLLTGWDNPLRYMQVPSEWTALPGMGDEHALAWSSATPSGPLRIRRRPACAPRSREHVLPRQAYLEMV